MLTGIHFLLTYKCSFKCDHCFVFSSPEAKGTFTISQIRDTLAEAKKIGTIKWIYFEGGEPFLYYPVMLEAVRISKNMGFKVGIVSNAYYATTEEDAELWLSPLKDLGVSDLSISDDSYHYEEENNYAKNAIAAAGKLGLPVDSITIERPKVEPCSDGKTCKGAPIVGGSSMFRGRAVETLTEGLPTRNWREFKDCPHEELRNPERVHIDPYGNVHLCQGLIIGNMFDTPLSELVKNYAPDKHPVSGPLLRGGPAALAKEHNVAHEDEYVDECHMCYEIRKGLLDKFPEYLAPPQVYGRE